MSEHADNLQERIEAAREWPPKWIADHYRDLQLWRAFRESDRDILRQRHPGWEPKRQYRIDPLPERIPEAFGDLIYGEDFTATAADEADQQTLDDAIDANELPSELQEAVAISSAEGAVWWRIRVDEDASDYPIIDWQSGLNTIPLWRGRRPVAIAFHTVIATDENQSKVWRYIEIHADGIMRSLLYVGSRDKLGGQVDLTARDEVRDLDPEWVHGLPMLAGVVKNKVGKRLGRSDYAGVRDLFFDLNEAAVIGSENARMTLKKRVVVPQRFLDSEGRMPAGADIIIATETDQDPDKPGQGLAQIEWSFDADAWIAWDGSLTDKILTRCRVAPQLVGRNVGNTPESGSALRARLLDSVMAANGKARQWDDSLPYILLLMLQVYALDGEHGGLDGTIANLVDRPAVERTPALPEDPREEADRHAVLVTAEIESRETAVRDLHPDWDDRQIRDELQRIADDQPMLGGPPPQLDDERDDEDPAAAA